MKTKIQWGKKWPSVYLNRHFTEEDVQLTKKYMEDFSTLLVLREMKIKTTRSQYISSKMIKIETDSTKSWQRCGTVGTKIS